MTQFEYDLIKETLIRAVPVFSAELTNSLQRLLLAKEQLEREVEYLKATGVEADSNSAPKETVEE